MENLAQQIVEKLHILGMSDRSIGIAIGRTRETICNIRNGRQSGKRCLPSLLKLYLIPSQP